MQLNAEAGYFHDNVSSEIRVQRTTPIEIIQDSSIWRIVAAKRCYIQKNTEAKLLYILTLILSALEQIFLYCSYL